MLQSQPGACDSPLPNDLLILFAAIAVSIALMIEITISATFTQRFFTRYAA
jgi:hypothetical protein